LPTKKKADAVLDGPAGQYFNKKLEEAGLVNLAYWENGFRNLTNSKRAVSPRPEDFDGVKVRVMQNNIFLDTFKTLGTNAVPMAFGEVFTALETKTIDGQENPFVTIETSKFNEVQKYLSVTRHAYTPFLVLYSKKLWDQLSPQEQAVLREAAMEGQKVQRAANRTLNEKSLATLKAKGMQSMRSPPPSRSACSTRSSPCMTKTCPPSALRLSPKSWMHSRKHEADKSPPPRLPLRVLCCPPMGAFAPWGGPAALTDQ
jgi:TRAP-type C4-dicarboxylate transport system substrate-binding protein